MSRSEKLQNTASNSSDYRSFKDDSEHGTDLSVLNEQNHQASESTVLIPQELDNKAYITHQIVLRLLEVSKQHEKNKVDRKTAPCSLKYFIGLMLLGGKIGSCAYPFLVYVNGITTVASLVKHGEHWEGLPILADAVSGSVTLCDVINTFFANTDSIFELVLTENWLAGIADFLAKVYHQEIPLGLVITGAGATLANGYSAYVGFDFLLNHLFALAGLEHPVANIVSTVLSIAIGAFAAICFWAFQVIQKALKTNNERKAVEGLIFALYDFTSDEFAELKRLINANSSEFEKLHEKISSDTSNNSNFQRIHFSPEEAKNLSDLLNRNDKYNLTAKVDERRSDWDNFYQEHKWPMRWNEFVGFYIGIGSAVVTGMANCLKDGKIEISPSRLGTFIVSSICISWFQQFHGGNALFRFWDIKHKHREESKDCSECKKSIESVASPRNQNGVSQKKEQSCPGFRKVVGWVDAGGSGSRSIIGALNLCLLASGKKALSDVAWYIVAGASTSGLFMAIGMTRRIYVMKTASATEPGHVSNAQNTNTVWRQADDVNGENNEELLDAQEANKLGDAASTGDVSMLINQ